MKKFIVLASILITLATTASAAVWNYPQDGKTVGNPTLFDCTAPTTPNYIKLWVAGSSIWTVHNTNRLAIVYYLPNGTYTVNCQYDDGAIHDNRITITVANNLYDAPNVDDDPYTNTNPDWEKTTGCGSPCTIPIADSQYDTTKSTDGNSREFFASRNSGGGDFQDVYFYEKRCGQDRVIGKRAGHYMVNFNAEAGTTPRAFEFGFSQWFGGRNYRMAVQANYAQSGGAVWRLYNPGGTGWQSTNVTLAQAPIPTNQFKRIYIVGHPYTDGSGNERVNLDLIQVGECTNAPCSDRDADPVRPVPVTQNSNVPTFSEACFGTEGNSQSVQIDLDTTRTSSQIWTDKYYVHLQP